MIKSKLIFAIIILTAAGCSQKGRITDPGGGNSNLNEYIPVKAGNSWTYSGFTGHASGMSDSSAPSLRIVSILQTNALIAGQPNAFIVQTGIQNGNPSCMVFSINGNTLWTYLGSSGTFNVDEKYILWESGGAGGVVVGANQTQKYLVTDNYGTTMSFSILRPPDPSTARAVMTAQDTVQISGISAGETMCTLKRIGGSDTDTMAVLIGVTGNPSPSGMLSLPPWIPVWQLTNSSSDAAVFSFDTVRSFRCIGDSSECRDELNYLATNRYVGSESVSAMNMQLQCERFEMKITVYETITLTSKIQTQVLFSGLSTSYVIDTWLARGIGFVKGSINGNSRSLVTSMGGTRDSSGVLTGYYISPRVAYLSLPAYANTQEQYFHVDVTPLAASPIWNEFILARKNF